MSDRYEKDFDVSGLRASIEQCKKSILNYEEAIAHEEAQIKKYGIILSDVSQGRPHGGVKYDPQGLNESIEHSRKNIGIYEGAISGERTNMANYRQMIETLERKQILSEGVTLDAS